MQLITDIHSSPPPFEFDFLLSPNSNPKDEMSTDQGSIKIEEVREREKDQEDGGDGDVSMTTGMSPPSTFPSSSSPSSYLIVLSQTIRWSCQLSVVD
jgi:hypothetical protein